MRPKSAKCGPFVIIVPPLYYNWCGSFDGLHFHVKQIVFHYFRRSSRCRIRNRLNEMREAKRLVAEHVVKHFLWRLVAEECPFLPAGDQRRPTHRKARKEEVGFPGEPRRWR